MKVLILWFCPDLLSCRPDVGVFGLQVGDADPFVTLFPHQTVSMELRVGRHCRHQLHHYTGWTLVVTDLKHENSQELTVCILGLNSVTVTLYV